MAEARQPLARLRGWFRTVTTVILSVILVALTLVTVVDVIGRYVFNSPVPGGTELTELLVMASIYAGLPAICLDDGHVTVDMLIAKLTGAWAGWQLAAARLVVAVVLGLVAWQLWIYGLRLAASTQTTMFLRIPIAPVAFGVSLIAGFSSALTLFMAVRNVPHG